MTRILLIEEQACGDAVMATSIINRIENTQDVKVDVLCKKEMAPVFLSCNKINRVWIQNFWINRKKSWNFVKQWQIISKIRKQHYDYVIDIFGDVRERLIGYLSEGKTFITVEHTKDFNFRGLYRLYSNFVRYTFTDLADLKYYDYDVANYYYRLKKIMADVGVKFLQDEIATVRFIRTVGLHPFASQQCKEWSFENWRTLTDRLLEQGKTIIVFGAPNERKILEEQFGVYGKRIELFTGSLQEFMDKLRELDLMIGLDSFSIHAAYAAGVRNIMINGANDYRMWQTPLTTVVSAHDDSCKYWPCYNKPRCSGKFSCINSITVEDVMEKVGEVL